MLAQWKWLSEGLINPYTLDHFHSLSFVTLLQIAEASMKVQMECQGARGGGGRGWFGIQPSSVWSLIWICAPAFSAPMMMTGHWSTIKTHNFLVLKQWWEFNADERFWKNYATREKGTLETGMARGMCSTQESPILLQSHMLMFIVMSFDLEAELHNFLLDRPAAKSKYVVKMYQN